jgi:hypothetical protein
MSERRMGIGRRIMLKKSLFLLAWIGIICGSQGAAAPDSGGEEAVRLDFSAP